MPRRQQGPVYAVQKRLAEITEELEHLTDLIGMTSTHGTLDEVVSLFADIKHRQDQVKTVSAKLAKLSDEMSYTVIPDLFARTNTVSPYNHIRGKFTLSQRTNASVIDGKKAPAYDWLRANNLGDIIIETIPWQTLGATAAELIKESRDLPPSLFDVKTRIYTSFTPAGKKTNAA